MERALAGFSDAGRRPGGDGSSGPEVTVQKRKFFKNIVRLGKNPDI
jgi:hypothetical protein